MIIVCPDCKRKNEISKENGRHQCKKCLQFIIVENKKAICCIPKEFFL